MCNKVCYSSVCCCIVFVCWFWFLFGELMRARLLENQRQAVWFTDVLTECTQLYACSGNAGHEGTVRACHLPGLVRLWTWPGFSAVGNWHCCCCPLAVSSVYRCTYPAFSARKEKVQTHSQAQRDFLRFRLTVIMVFLKKVFFSLFFKIQINSCIIWISLDNEGKDSPFSQMSIPAQWMCCFVGGICPHPASTYPAYTGTAALLPPNTHHATDIKHHEHEYHTMNIKKGKSPEFNFLGMLTSNKL